MNIFTDLVNPNLIQMGISRQSIVEYDISHALKNLNFLVSTPEMVKRSSGALSLSVVGYDTDPRELVEIPEVRRYFKALVDAYPYWFHVLNRLDESLSLIFYLSANSCEVIRHPNGSFATTYETDELVQFLKRHVAHLDSLHQVNDVADKDTETVASLVTNYYETKVGLD